MTPEQELKRIAEIAEDPESVLFDHIQETESKFDESEGKLNEVKDDIEDLDERLKEEAKKNLVVNLEMAKEELSDVSDKIEEQTKLMVEHNKDKSKYLQICQYLETIKEILKKEDKEDYSEIIKAINRASDKIKDPKETKIDLNPVLDQLKSFKKVIKDDRVKVELLDKQIDRIVNAVSFPGGRGSSGTFNKVGTQINPATEEKQDAIVAALGSVSIDTSTLATETTLDAIRDNIGEAVASPTANTTNHRLASIQAYAGEINDKMIAGVQIANVDGNKIYPATSGDIYELELLEGAIYTSVGASLGSDTTAIKTAVQLLDNAVDGNYLNTNLNIAGTDVAAGAGTVNAQTQRVTIATDDEVNNLLGTIDADTSNISTKIDTLVTELQVNNGAVAMQVDDAGSGVTYQGWAEPGTSVATAGWRIRKITATGSDYSIQFADGNRNFDNVWNNRAALSYS